MFYEGIAGEVRQANSEYPETIPLLPKDAGKFELLMANQLFF